MPLAMRQAKQDLLDKPSKFNNHKKATDIHLLAAWAKNYQQQAKTPVANDANHAPTRKRRPSIQKGKGKSEYISKEYH